jgi:V8-like Glu-specific endopeptidase
MINIKKNLVITGLVLVTLAGCGNNKTETEKPSPSTTNIETSEKATENKEAPTENVSMESDQSLANENENASDNEAQALSDEDMAFIDDFVDKMENFENGTAGTTLKADILFTDFINNAGFVEDKLEEAKEYFSTKANEVQDKDNFTQTLDTLKGKINQYRNDQDNFMQELEASGSEWNPEISVDTFEEFLDI